MAMLDLFSDGDPVVEWQTSMIDQSAEEHEIEIMDVRFVLKQDPHKLDNSDTAQAEKDLRNVVWDGSMSAVKLLECGHRTGDPALAKGSLSEKNCLELGSGCAGLGGLACALLGPRKVVVSDVASITPLLRHNVDSFLRAAGDRPGLCTAVTVMELEWCKPEDMAAVQAEGPFDFVVCNDLLYTPGNIELIGTTLQPLLHVCNPARSSENMVLYPKWVLKSVLLQPSSVILFVDSTFSYSTEKALKAFVEAKGLGSREVPTEGLDAADRHEGIHATIVTWRQGLQG